MPASKPDAKKADSLLLTRNTLTISLPSASATQQSKNTVTGKISAAKVYSAVAKAFEAQNKNYVPSIIDFIALKVTADFESKIKDGMIAVEDIQDSVENVLVQAGYSDVAKAYILYRKNREKLRNMKSTVLDYKDVVDDYLLKTSICQKTVPVIVENAQ